MEELVKVEESSLQGRSQTLKPLIDRFLLAQDVKEKSKLTYRKALKQFFSHITENRAASLSREDIISYKESLSQRGLSAATLSTYLVAVRKFFEWAESAKLYPNIARGIKGAKKSRGFKKDALTVEQVKRVLTSIDSSSLQGKRDFALLNLLVRTGLRTIEVIRANVEDMRQEGGEALLYIQGKGRDAKDEFVLLTEETLAPIRVYLAERKETLEDAPLFASLSDRNRNKRLTTRSLSRISKTYLRGAGLDDRRLTAHSFRHTAVTLSLMGGATIQEAQSLARHTSLNTTLIYAHNINRVENAPERKIDKMLAAVN